MPAITLETSNTLRNTCSDSITEIRAAIDRLLKLKRQIEANRDFIINCQDNAINKTTVRGEAEKVKDAKIIQWDVNLYKNQGIRRTYKDTDGTIAQEGADVSPVLYSNGKHRGKNIFKSYQLDSSAATISTGGNTKLIMDKVHRWLISVNAFLTQTNDITTINADATEAIVPTNGQETEDISASASAGDISKNYLPGGQHKLNEEVFKNILFYPGSVTDGVTIANVATENVTNRGQAFLGFSL